MTVNAVGEPPNIIVVTISKFVEDGFAILQVIVSVDPVNVTVKSSVAVPP